MTGFEREQLFQAASRHRHGEHIELLGRRHAEGFTAGAGDDVIAAELLARKESRSAHGQRHAHHVAIRHRATLLVHGLIRGLAKDLQAEEADIHDLALEVAGADLAVGLVPVR